MSELSNTSGSEPLERQGKDWIAPCVLVLLFLLLPYVLSLLVSANILGWAVLIALTLTVTVLAIVDARTFRSSWSIPLLAGISFWIASRLYFNEGTWIYIPLFIVLAWGFGKVSGSSRSHIPNSGNEREA
ncbi:MAG: hypothetical protein Q3974_05890 [Rothia sp. (in: high G+C Gram-positive bacteria)]|nr:hypothetical protein [Rothia sp. (in: high G+C Gram-positive bacteria)]